LWAVAFCALSWFFRRLRRSRPAGRSDDFAPALGLAALYLAIGLAVPAIYDRVSPATQSPSLFQWHWSRIANIQAITAAFGASQTAASVAIAAADWISIGTLIAILISVVGALREATGLESNRRARTRALAAIMAVSMVIDVGAIVLNPPGPDSGETGHWWPIITNVVQGRGYLDCPRDFFPLCDGDNQVTASREPFPVLLFASVARATGDSFLAAAVVELLMHLAIGLGVYRIGRLVAGARTALTATVLWALYIPALQWIPQISGELPAALAMVWGTVWLLCARSTNRRRDWMVAGLLFGIAALSRMAMLAVAAAMSAALLVGSFDGATGRRVRRMERLRVLVLMGLVTGTTLSPWVIRNYLALGSPIVGTTLSGYNLYRYNFILATDDYMRFVAWREAAVATRRVVASSAAIGPRANEAQLEALYRDEAIAIIRAHPFRYAALSSYRFLMLWFDWGVNSAYGEPVTAFDFFAVVIQTILLVTLVMGVGVSWGPSLPLAIAVTAAAVMHMAVCAHLRFLIPVVPLVVVLSAQGFLRSTESRGFSRKSRANL
jgi:hypothetical protein